MKKWPRLHLPIQVVVCTACFGLALPVSIALFPQTSEVGYYAASSSLVTWYLASENSLALAPPDKLHANVLPALYPDCCC